MASKIERTIIKSKLRAHADRILVEQFIDSIQSGANIGTATSATLTTAMVRFSVTAPTAAEIAAYVPAARTSTPIGGVFGNPAGDIDVDNEPDDAEPMIGATATAPASPAGDVAEAAAIVAEVKGVMALLGAGDMIGYQRRLAELVTEARKPAKVVHVRAAAAIDASKIKGGVPKIVGTLDMHGAGLPKALGGVKIAATMMANYDGNGSPGLDDDYTFPDETGLILSQAARGKAAFLTGPAGTGKTTFAQQIAARFGRRFVRISCDDQTEAAQLVGMTVPKAGGGVEWQDGQLAAAIRCPGTIILIDEPSLARPGALFVFQSVLDSDRKLHIAETGEVIEVAPDVLFMAADNTNGTGDMSGQYEATRRLNRAFLDRFGVTVAFQYMDPVAEAKAIAAHSGCNKKLAAALARFATITRTRADEGKIAHPVGMRRLITLAEQMTDGVTPANAFQAAVLATAPFDDREPLRQFWTADFDEKAAL